MAYLLKPAHQPQPGTELVQRIDWTPGGLGCTDCGGKCGMGLFDSGVDISGWSWPEWGSVFAGVFMLISTASTTHRAARAIAAAPGNRRKRKAAKYRAMASELTKKRK